jgi:predicted adenine nucleotide alpha hydrolase (AANH) superfamily ATPase
MKVALHACCGPCLLEPLDALAAEHDVTVVYANPNIQPHEEYEHRRDTLEAWARDNDVRVVEVDYDPAEWSSAVRGVEDEPPLRCARCFELRLAMTARVAADLGCEAVATTLSVSPYQDHDAIVAAGRAACAPTGVPFLETDFRERYPDATRRSRELGMYRQNYCGCLPSRAEADSQRTQRKAARLEARARGGADPRPTS